MMNMRSILGLVGRKDRRAAGLPVPPALQPGVVSISGIELERTARTHLGMTIQWQIDEMAPLLMRMRQLGYYVTIYPWELGWICAACPNDLCEAIDHYYDSDQSPAANGMVAESGMNPFTALARCAVAAVQQWPEV